MTAPPLAARQAELVAALVRGTPTDLDARGVALTADTLIRKRWDSVRRHWPILVASLAVAASSRATGPQAARPDARGEDAGEWFRQWALHHRAMGGLPAGGHGDGLLFAHWLEADGALPAAAAAEIATGRLTSTLRADGSAVERRRWRGVAISRAGRNLALGWGRAGPQRVLHLRIPG